MARPAVVAAMVNVRVVTHGDDDDGKRNHNGNCVDESGCKFSTIDGDSVGCSGGDGCRCGVGGGSESCSNSGGEGVGGGVEEVGDAGHSSGSEESAGGCTCVGCGGWHPRGNPPSNHLLRVNDSFIDTLTSKTFIFSSSRARGLASSNSLRPHMHLTIYLLNSTL